MQLIAFGLIIHHVKPWNNWFHCIGTAKENWVRGDSRGWRARHHREHIEGDYKNPPPRGQYDTLERDSKRLMTTAAITLQRDVRVAACRKLIEALHFYNVEVVDLAVTLKHYHVLARFTPIDRLQNTPATGVAGLCEAHYLKDGRDPVPRYILGKCHSWCSRELKNAFGHSFPASGGLWAPRPKCVPIENRAHQLRVVRYIRDHVKQGAAVWSVIRYQSSK